MATTKKNNNNQNQNQNFAKTVKIWQRYQNFTETVHIYEKRKSKSCIKSQMSQKSQHFAKRKDKFAGKVKLHKNCPNSSNKWPISQKKKWYFSK